MDRIIRYFRERILDGLLANAIFYVLVIIVPLVLGFLLGLEFQIILLLIIVVSQFIIFVILFSINGKLVSENKIDRKYNFEAQNSLEIVKKDVQIKDDQKILSFYFRYKNEHVFQINSAKLFFDFNAPLTASDIFYKNIPMFEGVLTSKLLFNGESESKKIFFGEEPRLDLIITRELSQKDITRIKNSVLGYIEIKGIYREADVTFHVDI